MAAINESAPAMLPPAGITPNFDNPPNSNEIARFALIFTMVIATLCLMLRAYGKVYKTKKLDVEDLLVLLGYGNYWGCFYASYSLLFHPGYFVHNWDILIKDTILPSYYIFVFGVFYSVVLASIKVAILVEWCRIFVAGRTGVFWWGAVSIIILQIAFCIAAIFLLNFQCIPHSAIWDVTITKKKCLPLNPLQLLSASIHAFSDAVIFILPQRVVWTLKMSLRKKLGVAVIFGLGALAVICSIFRLTATIAYGRGQDTLHNISPVVLWATGEMACGFFIVCMPYLPRALKGSRLSEFMKKSLYIKSSSDASTGKMDKNCSPSAAPGKNNDTYVQIDEDGMALRNLNGSESTQNLNCGLSNVITLTTHITIKRDNNSDYKTSENSSL